MEFYLIEIELIKVENYDSISAGVHFIAGLSIVNFESIKFSLKVILNAPRPRSY